MVIVQLNGGMGNQMFQYANARAISLRRNDKFKLDINFFKTTQVDTPREYELHKLNVVEELATIEEISRIKGFEPSFARKVVNKLFPAYAKKHVREYGMGFLPRILKLGGELYLEGFWQSEKYFVDAISQLKSDFTVKRAPSAENQRLLDMISKCENPVSLHVRRGDYVAVANTAAFHGVCSPEYYSNSIEEIKSKVKNPTFFLFSDEPEWAKENIKTDTETFVSYNSVSDQDEDLRLMYSCKHHIIANSSFSWWGAWLSRNPEKVVCAPAQWFANKDVDSSDIVPESWTKIPS